jgi:hypothetical protein
MQGYSEAENTWEPVEHIDNCPDKVRVLRCFEMRSQASLVKVVVDKGWSLEDRDLDRRLLCSLSYMRTVLCKTSMAACSVLNSCRSCC